MGDARRVSHGLLPGQGGKLRWAGRAWAAGTLHDDGREDELEADARFFGIPVALVRRADDQDGVWPEHLPALERFLAVQTQWCVEVGMRGAFWLGLDYGACESGLRLAGFAPDPELWAEVRLIEDGAKQELNGR